MHCEYAPTRAAKAGPHVGMGILFYQRRRTGACCGKLSKWVCWSSSTRVCDRGAVPVLAQGALQREYLMRKAVLEQELQAVAEQAALLAKGGARAQAVIEALQGALLTLSQRPCAAP